VLSECREEDDSCATLARLKMAIQYEEKKVSNETRMPVIAASPCREPKSVSSLPKAISGTSGQRSSTLMVTFDR